MHINRAMRYQLNDLVRPTIIYYCVMLGMYALSLLTNVLVTGSVHGINSTFDMSSVIFLFVMGLNAFKNPFRVYQQNGISRRTQWFGFLLSALALAAVVTLLDVVILPFLLGGVMDISSTYAMVYQQGAGFAEAMRGILWNLMAYYAVMCFGYFITTLYYRMGKLQKVLVSAGVPLLLFVVLPMVEMFVPTFQVFTSLLKFLGWALGIELSMTSLMFGMGDAIQVFPMRAVGTFTVVSVVSLALAFLLMRRATLKES